MLSHSDVTYSILSRADRSLSTTSSGLSRSLLFICIAWRILDSRVLTLSSAALTPSVSGSGGAFSMVAVNPCEPSLRDPQASPVLLYAQFLLPAFPFSIKTDAFEIPPILAYVSTARATPTPLLHCRCWR